MNFTKIISYFFKKKIHIVWIVNDLYTNNFITVYKECKKYDSNFKITIIATSHNGFSKTDYISSDEIYTFLKKKNKMYKFLE